jgi:hypothetical protein
MAAAKKTVPELEQEKDVAEQAYFAARNGASRRRLSDALNELRAAKLEAASERRSGNSETEEP